MNLLSTLKSKHFHAAIHLFGFLALAIACISVACLWNIPIRNRTRAATLASTEYQRKLGTYKDDEAAVHGLRKSMQVAIERKTRICNRIPFGKQEAAVLEQISKVASDEGIVVADYRRGQVTNGASFSSYPIQLRCQSRFLSLCRFLDRIQELDRITTVQRLSVSHSKDEGVYPVDITLVLYFYPQSEGNDRREKAETETVLLRQGWERRTT